MFIIPAPSDIAFKIMNFPIYWYGIMMAIAIFVGIVVGNKLFNRFNDDKCQDVILNYAPLIILFGIFGARLYFCCLNPVYYFAHPLEILDIREGGLSIHGAIIGGILSIFFVACKQKISFFRIIDPLACSTILAQSIGRWGNYFNSEAYGLPVVGQNWGLYVPQNHRVEEYIQYNLFHPTFLYESILDFFAFLILFYVYKKFGTKYAGITMFSYFIIYSIVRFIIESIRIDSALNIGMFPIAKIVSLVLFFIGIIGLVCVFCKNTTRSKC